MPGAGLGAALVAGVALVLVVVLFGVSPSAGLASAAPGTPGLLIGSQGLRISSGML